MTRRRLMRLASEQVDEPDDRDDDYTAEDAADDKADRDLHSWQSGDYDHIPPSERPLWVQRLEDVRRRLDELRRMQDGR